VVNPIGEYYSLLGLMSRLWDYEKVGMKVCSPEEIKKTVGLLGDDCILLNATLLP